MKILYGFIPALLLAIQVFAHPYTDEKKAKALVHREMENIIGWCSQAKSEFIMDLVLKTKPEVCVELGVFGGASLFPTAMALKSLNHGVVYGVDAWDVSECVKYFPEESANRNWWMKLDLGAIRDSCFSLIQSYRLGQHCKIIESTFADAAPQIEAIDILHIDAMHCNEGDLEAMLLYFPKVKVGGYILFDGWTTSALAFDLVEEFCEIIEFLPGENCVLLQKLEEMPQE